jgi:hypothetical protein
MRHNAFIDSLERRASPTDFARQARFTYTSCRHLKRVHNRAIICIRLAIQPELPFVESFTRGPIIRIVLAEEQGRIECALSAKV